MDARKVLVTGADGYIGDNLKIPISVLIFFAALLRRADDVKKLVNSLHVDSAGTAKSLKWWQAPSFLET